MAYGRAEALDMISVLSQMLPEQLEEGKQRMARSEEARVLQQIRYFGSIDDFLNLPMTRNDFDRIYAAHAAEGVENPREFIKHEADLYDELLTNPNDIGRQFFGYIRARRFTSPRIMGALLDMAAQQGMPEDVLVQKLEKHIDQVNETPLPSENLTEEERYYIRVRQDMNRYVAEHFYYNTPHTAPADSPWAQRVMAILPMGKSRFSPS